MMAKRSENMSKNQLILMMSMVFLWQLMPEMGAVGVIRESPLQQTKEILTAQGIQGEQIQQVIDVGIMSNYPDGLFHPERGMVRAELAAILVKNFDLGVREGNGEEIILRDVPRNHWAYEEIQIVVRTGIMTVDDRGRFLPDLPVTRAAGWAAFAQAYGVLPFGEGEVARLLSPYQDRGEIPGWGREAIATMVFEELINVNGSRLYPDRPITRGEMVYTLSQYLAKQQNPGTIPSIPLDP
uniref:S-layer homology domain-containing protein n=1 Tax=Planktothricoides sp. SpSt-374 TaxID=2282167 RepID=A0A7C3VSQ4_9CYAN